MAAFEHCHFCKPPVRHPGCHSECPHYEAVGVPVSDILAESLMPKNDMLSPEEIGKNIKRWSMLRGISIRKLAEKAGIGHTSVQSIREGRCMSSMLTYWYIAKALDVTVGTLLGETGGAE